jgi:aspartyl-tRNA(Asn)/glutamyl-tRNA(Gln) amidotransferase subunit A
MAPLHFSSIAEIQTEFRSGKLTAVALTQHLLERIAIYNGKLNAFITVATNEALAAAEKADDALKNGGWLGPLHGIPVAIKDNIDTSGIRTTAGSRLYATRVATQDAEVVSRLKAAGAIILGKTGTHELAYGTTSENLFFGRIANPWDVTRDPGGSSGGSAVAVAVGLAFAAIGTDTACSIRHPAHCCGVVGFKPSLGLTSTAGVLPLVHSLDHVGPFARSAEDVALVTQVIAQHWPNQRPLLPHGDQTDGFNGLRFGISRSFFFTGDPEILSVVERALGILEARGADIVNIDGTALEESGEITRVLFAEAFAQFADALAVNRADFSPELQWKLACKENISAKEYIWGQQKRQDLIAEIDAMFEHCDVLAAPTSTTLPAQVDVRPDDYDMHASRNATVFNLGGHPSISIPCGVTAAGMPVGLMLSGTRNGDIDLLHRAKSVESALNLHDLHPPIVDLF